MLAFVMFTTIALLVALISHLVGAAALVTVRRVHLWLVPPPRARRRQAQRISIVRETRQVLQNTLYAENLAFAALLTGVCRVVLFFVSMVMMAWNCSTVVARTCVGWVCAGFEWIGEGIGSVTRRVLSYVGLQARSNPTDGTLRDQLEQSLRHALENGRPQLATQR